MKSVPCLHVVMPNPPLVFVGVPVRHLAVWGILVCMEGSQLKAIIHMLLGRTGQMFLCIPLLIRLCHGVGRNTTVQVHLTLRLPRGHVHPNFQAMISDQDHDRATRSDQPLKWKVDAALTDQSKGMRLQLRNASRACTSITTVIPIQQQKCNIKPHVDAPQSKGRL